MSPTAADLLKQVLSLDEKDRASTTGALIESLEAESEPGVEEAWAAVIERRISELDAGTVQTVPWSEVRGRLFHGYLDRAEPEQA
jgi:putative addiction module component (TIGR02574 family)